MAMSDLPKITNSKTLKNKVNDFLGLQRKDSDLVEIIKYFEECFFSNAPMIPCILAVEQIFSELLKRNEMFIEVKPLKPKVIRPEHQYRVWLQDRYKEAFRLLLICMNTPRQADSVQALYTSMQLIGYEGQYPIEQSLDCNFPTMKFRNILSRLLSSEKSNHHLLLRLKEFSCYLDVIFYAWKLLPGLTVKGNSPSECYIQNYIDLITAFPITVEVQESKQYLCGSVTLSGHSMDVFDYVLIRKNISKSIGCAIFWDFSQSALKRLLLVLLENIIQHLDRPLILTDFLMETLDIGGPVSLLALQAVFILVQKDNLTHPSIYEKLYSMFEPEIFHTKYKARLYCLADIFLSSSHIPEMLVAAFIKRLARLTLVVPPQDIIIILQFIGNLIKRHPGLKRLMNNTIGNDANLINACDPYIMEESDPYKSKAMESSLWEILTLKNHLIPSVAETAKFILNPKSNITWDLGKYIELNENDIFDQEIMKQSKQYALNPDIENKHEFLRNDYAFSNFWKLY